MQLLSAITDAADQLLAVSLPDGSVAQLELFYRPAIQRWTVDINHPLLNMHGFNLTQGPNILRQWRNIVPFGMALISKNGLDPMYAEDFSNGNCQLYILTPGEVELVETEILNALPLVNP